MKLYSTVRQSAEVGLKEALFRGLPPDNGLYMPERFPVLSEDFFENIQRMPLTEIAYKVSRALLKDDVEEKALKEIVEEAINFDAPLQRLNDNMYVLELFHGPTLAFKDFGARFMARLMAYFIEKSNKQITILVATSGDTGSAVAQGFLGVDGINVVVLYPKGKVSEIQEKQFTTLGQNIVALEIDGSFDDCQKLVKTAFLDKELNEKMRLTSANSINIGRLIPQTFYYFYAYAKLQAQGRPVVFSVPSGNFGNLCGGLIAKKMGLPVSRFVAATNVNDIFPKYLLSGDFLPRASVQTISNAMDVGNPSNFARILDLYKNDVEKIREDIFGAAFDDEETKKAVYEVSARYEYTLDPHSAVGYLGLTEYFKKVKNKSEIGVILATAHPSKFLDIVEEVTGSKVIIPDRLRRRLDYAKKSIPLSANYSELKDFLLGR